MTGPFGAWKPSLALADTAHVPVRQDRKQTLFLGTLSISDPREIFIGDGFSNQIAAVAINGDVAERIVNAVNAHDDTHQLLIASYHALRSYECGNAATELAKSIADKIESRGLHRPVQAPPDRTGS